MMQDKPTNISRLILVANPNKNSLAVHAADLAHKSLLKQNIGSSFFHLDAMPYNPILSQEEISRRSSFDDVTNHLQTLLFNSRTLALFFPDWWGFPPAIMVGCLQRIFAPSVAFIYEGKEFMPKEKRPLLSHLRVVFAICSDEKDSSAIEATCSTFCDRLFKHAGIDDIVFSVLPDSKHTSTHNKNIWFRKNIELLQRQ